MSVTEQELKAISVAPRVSAEDVENNIAATYYLNGEAAINALGNFSNEHVKCLTICILVTVSGFTIVGKSACARPENYNAEIGQRLAREDAVRQLWGFMGYHL